MKESKHLEFEAEINNTFLKTVSVFSNYDGGQIKFGIADDGKLLDYPIRRRHVLI